MTPTSCFRTLVLALLTLTARGTSSSQVEASSGGPARPEAPVGDLRFGGRYNLVLTLGASCAPGTAGPTSASVAVDLTETTIVTGSEVESEPLLADDGVSVFRMVLLRRGANLHGPAGVQNSDVFVRTNEGLWVWTRLMISGSTSARAGRLALRGTAAGTIWLLSSDGSADVGYCTAVDHLATLEPQ